MSEKLTNPGRGSRLQRIGEALSSGTLSLFSNKRPTSESSKSKEVPQHPDSLIAKLIKIQDDLPFEERLKLLEHGGGGDITIEIQDDMPLVQVMQGNYVLGVGDSIQTALDVSIAYFNDTDTRRQVDNMFPLNLEKDPFYQ